MAKFNAIVPSEESGVALLLFPGDCSGAITKMKDVLCYLCLDYLKASRKSRSESSSSTCKQVTLEARYVAHNRYTSIYRD